MTIVKGSCENLYVLKNSVKLVKVKLHYSVSVEKQIADSVRFQTFISRYSLQNIRAQRIMIYGRLHEAPLEKTER